MGVIKVRTSSRKRKTITDAINFPRTFLRKTIVIRCATPSSSNWTISSFCSCFQSFSHQLKIRYLKSVDVHPICLIKILSVYFEGSSNATQSNLCPSDKPRLPSSTAPYVTVDKKMQYSEFAHHSSRNRCNLHFLHLDPTPSFFSSSYRTQSVVDTTVA